MKAATAVRISLSSRSWLLVFVQLSVSMTWRLIQIAAIARNAQTVPANSSE